MTQLPDAPPQPIRRMLASPPARVLLPGLVLLMLMGLNTDVKTRHAGQPFKAVQHTIAPAMAGFAVSALQRLNSLSELVPAIAMATR